MDLADRRRGDRFRVELDEQLADRASQLGFDRGDDQVGRHRRGVRLQLAQRLPQRLGQALVEIAGHLAELHQRTLHVAELVGDLLGRGQLAGPVEFGTALGRREGLARGGAGVHPADPGPEAGEAEVAGEAGRAEPPRGTLSHGQANPARSITAGAPVHRVDRPEQRRHESFGVGDHGVVGAVDPEHLGAGDRARTAPSAARAARRCRAS